MKILAFTDIHSSMAAFKKLQSKVKRYKPDYVFCAGDITIFGQDPERMLRKINILHKKIFLIHGNHDLESETRKLCKKYSNITFVHKKIVKIDKKYTLVAHGGGGFYGCGEDLAPDKKFESFVKRNKDKIKGKILFMTHAPPARTKLDYLNWMDDHVGCTSYADFIKKYKPLLAISGHLHETFKVKQKMGKTIMCNPGPFGILFEV